MAHVVGRETIVLQFAHRRALEPGRNLREIRLVQLQGRIEGRLERHRHLRGRFDSDRHLRIEVDLLLLGPGRVVVDGQAHFGLASAEVGDGRGEVDLHALAGDFRAGAEIGDADVVVRENRGLPLRPKRMGDIDEANLEVARRLGHFMQRRFDRVGLRPIALAKVADDMQRDAMILRRADDGTHLRHGVVRADVHQGRRQAFHVLFDLLERLRIADFVEHLEFMFGIDRLGHRQDDELVVRVDLGQALEDFVEKNVVGGDLEAVLGNAAFLPFVAHAEGVVDQNDMHALFAREVGHVEPDEPQHQQTDERDEEAAKEEEEQLFDDESSAIAFLGLEEELHRRPPDAFEAHAVDEMDDDGDADERRRRREIAGIQKPVSHCIPC